MADPEFKIGMTFSTVEQLREAISKYSTRLEIVEPGFRWSVLKVAPGICM